MRAHLIRTLLLAGLAATLLSPAGARAADLDLEVWRLGNPAADAQADARFRLLMVDLGLALTPTPMHPAETLGRVGTSVEVGVRVPEIHPRLALGSGCSFNPECRVWVTEQSDPGRSGAVYPNSYQVLPAVHVRKGLPFSFELDGRAQYLVQSSALALSAGARWSLNEGFMYLPDLSVGGLGTRFLGNRDFGLTTVGLDVMLGKTFGVAGMFALAPYAGWQRVWVSGVSEVIDFDPTTENPQNPTSDDTIFDDVTLQDNAYDRFFFGLRFNSSIVQVLGELTYQPQITRLGAPVPSALSFVAKIGVDL